MQGLNEPERFSRCAYSFDIDVLPAGPTMLALKFYGAVF